MDTAGSKEFSVVIRITEFSSLNGQLADFENEEHRQQYVKHFFLNKYGHGSGTLKVAQKQTKVKLTWIAPKHDEKAEEAHNEALVLARQKNYQEAISKWIKAISINSSDPDYYFNVGIAFFELKNFTEAIENFNKALSLCPIYYKAHLILGTVYLKTRKFDKAEQYLQESLVFYPDHPLAFLNLGAVYSILKRYDDGIKMFLRSIELSPKEVRAHFGLAKIYSLRGEREKANLHYKRVIEIGANPQLTNHAKRAMAATSQGASTQALSPEDSADVHNIERYYQEGYNAFLYSDYNKAVQMYTIYLKHKADDDFVWYSLGEACLRAGQVKRAIEAFEKAVAENGTKALYFKELAIAYSYVGDNENAVRCIEEVEKLDNLDSILLSVFGKILIQKQEYEHAIEKLELALKKNPANLLAKFNYAIAALQNNQRGVALDQLNEIVQLKVNTPIKMEAETLLSANQ